MRSASDKIRRELIQLRDKNPRLWALLQTWDAMTVEEQVVTSLLRGADRGVHGRWRGADLRVLHPSRPAAGGSYGLAAWEHVKRINRLYRYHTLRPWLSVAVLEVFQDGQLKWKIRGGSLTRDPGVQALMNGEFDPQTHIHFQTWGRGPWT